MTAKDEARELLDPSVQVLLAEHERLSGLYLSNADMGERRVSIYMTVVSITIVALGAAAQLGADPGTVAELVGALLAGLALFGLLTFQRLIERRVRSTEFLRAINRIYSRFVHQDPELEQYFSWPPNDDVPSFGGRAGALAGLRDVIAGLNSLFLGILSGLLAFSLWPTLRSAGALTAGIVVAVAAWFLQQEYERRSLITAEKKAGKNVRFPRRRAETGE